MIKYLMRKTVLKEADHETQDMLMPLITWKYIIKFICSKFWAANYMFTFITLFIINICEDVKFTNTTQIALMAFILIYFIGLLIFLQMFKDAMVVFTELIVEKMYFWLCTKKGKAISKQDFETIKKEKEKLYEFIKTQQCKGLCYSICYALCRALKKGSIELIAVKKTSYEKEDKDDDGKTFTMHVLYINNGWAFDTFSSLQFPIERLHQIYNAKIYRTFSFNEIMDKSYKEFRDEQEPELAEWSAKNDCYQSLKDKK